MYQSQFLNHPNYYPPLQYSPEFYPPHFAEPPHLHLEFINYIQEQKTITKYQQYIQYLINLILQGKCRVKAFSVVSLYFAEFNHQHRQSIYKLMIQFYPPTVDFIQEYIKISIINQSHLPSFLSLIDAIIRINCNLQSFGYGKRVNIEYILNGILIYLHLNEAKRMPVPNLLKTTIKILLEENSLLSNKSILQKGKLMYYLLIQNDYSYDGRMVELELCLFEKNTLFRYIFDRLVKQFQIGSNTKEQNLLQHISTSVIKVLQFRRWSIKEGIQLARMIQNCGDLMMESSAKLVNQAMKYALKGYKNQHQDMWN